MPPENDEVTVPYAFLEASSSTFSADDSDTLTLLSFSPQAETPIAMSPGPFPRGALWQRGSHFSRAQQIRPMSIWDPGRRGFN